MSKIKLFCLPYAGGSAMIYKRDCWEKYLGNSIELVPIELAGRGKRYNELLYSDLNEAVDDIYNLIKNDLNEEKYAIYGHSMGSILAYELYYKIKKSNSKEPIHIFFSGRKPPHIKDDNQIIHDLSIEEFKEEILKLGGTPKEVFEYRDLYEIFIPILRADYKVIEEYKYIKGREKINCSITILAGEDDNFVEKNIEEWEIHAQNECNIYILKGGHFFIHSNTKNITDIINNTLIMNRELM